MFVTMGFLRYSWFTCLRFDFFFFFSISEKKPVWIGPLFAMGSNSKVIGSSSNVVCYGPYGFMEARCQWAVAQLPLQAAVMGLKPTGCVCNLPINKKCYGGKATETKLLWCMHKLVSVCASVRILLEPLIAWWCFVPSSLSCFNFIPTWSLNCSLV